MRHLILLVIAAAIGLSSISSASAQVGFYSGFENDYRSWDTTGSAGYDLSTGNSLQGRNNGWIRATSGWNALTRRFMSGSLVATLACRTELWVRASRNVSDVYISFIDQNSGRVYGELGPLSGASLQGSALNRGYKLMRLPLVISYGLQPTGSGLPALRVGFWGNGQDAWVQIDEVYAACQRGTTFPPPWHPTSSTDIQIPSP